MVYKFGRKEPEGDVEELEGEKKKVEPPFPEPEPDEEEREREYQRMIDKLDNTLKVHKREKFFFSDFEFFTIL
jgi:hypothetical protein